MTLRFVRQLYSLDTLDTRFVVPATATPKEALQQNGKSSNPSAAHDLQPSRWNTLEFYIYYVSISASIFAMFKLVLEVSKSRYLVRGDSGAAANEYRITSHISPVLTSAPRWMDTWSQSSTCLDSPSSCVHCPW
jgi:hypothetical protein